MITHKTFIQRLKRILTDAQLQLEFGDKASALKRLEYAVMEIDVHTRHTLTKPPELLKVEREVFKRAYELQKAVA